MPSQISCASAATGVSFEHPMISATLTIILVVVSVVGLRVALSRRVGTGDRLNLGSVSQQWLLMHKVEDR